MRKAKILEKVNKEDHLDFKVKSIINSQLNNIKGKNSEFNGSVDVDNLVIEFESAKAAKVQAKKYRSKFNCFVV